MKTYKLAEYFDIKYQLKSEAQPAIPEIINSIKKDIINAYNLYVNSNTAKEPVLQMLADAGEPFCKALIKKMEVLIANIDQLATTPELLFMQVNKVLKQITDMKNDPEKKTRNFIHDSIRATRQAEKNYREHVKMKFELVIHRLSSIFETQARLLKAFLPKDEPLAGGLVERQRAALSKQKLLIFMHTPAAEFYGLDDLDVLERVLSFNDLREKVYTLINAIDRGHIPADGPEVMAEVKDIVEAFNIKETNEEYFDEGNE